MKLWHKQLIKYLLVMIPTLGFIHFLARLYNFPEMNYVILLGAIIGSIMLIVDVKLIKELEEDVRQNPTSVKESKS